MYKEVSPATIDPKITTKVNHLLDCVIEKFGLKNDAALSRALCVPPPVVSKLRHGRISLGPSIILNLHETFAIPVAHIRDYSA